MTKNLNLKLSLAVPYTSYTLFLIIMFLFYPLCYSEGCAIFDDRGASQAQRRRHSRPRGGTATFCERIMKITIKTIMMLFLYNSLIKLNLSAPKLLHFSPYYGFNSC